MKIYKVEFLGIRNDRGDIYTEKVKTSKNMYDESLISKLEAKIRLAKCYDFVKIVNVSW